MNPEQLLDAIGEVRDVHILDAAHASRTRGKNWYAAIAACLALTLVLGQFLGPAGAGREGSRDLSYAVYAGPVLPLTAQGETEGITAQRNVTLDFRDYDGTGSTEAALHVIDSYALANETAEDRTLQLCYPYTATLQEPQLCPLIWVNGTAVRSELYPGDFAGGFEGPWGSSKPLEGSFNLDLPASFEDYRTLLQDGSYQTRAFTASEFQDQTAYVYRLHDFTFPQDDGDAIYELRMECIVDPEGSQLYSCGAESSGSDSETGFHYWTATLRPKARPHEDTYVIVLGEDLTGYSLRGSRQIGTDELSAAEDVGCTVSRYETTWKKVLLHFLAEEGLYDSEQPRENTFAPGAVFHVPGGELYSSLAVRLLDQWGPYGEAPVERYADGRLRSILREASNMMRVLYLRFEVTIPAGEQVTVAAAMTKERSYDLGGTVGAGDGYDLATSLGSSLTFTRQTATLKNAEFIEITDQNFGFDPASGILTVPLTGEHHWLKVRSLKEKP